VKNIKDIFGENVIEQNMLTDLQKERQGIDESLLDLDDLLKGVVNDLRAIEIKISLAERSNDQVRLRSYRTVQAELMDQRADLSGKLKPLERRRAVISRQIQDVEKAMDIAAAKEGESQIKEAARVLLTAFEAFLEADEQYRALRRSFKRAPNRWPLGLFQLEPHVRNRFRQDLTRFLKGA